MTRTIINSELIQVARFLARLLKRNAPKQRKLIKALERFRLEAHLAGFDAWVDSEDELVRLTARAIRRHCTKSKVLQACVLCTQVAAQRGGKTGKMSELLHQRRDFIDCFIW